ncbi:hypothetical protein G7046_g7892 [Stylonectria norvegica]|nr:hypothetical protein G7046_g7892 [Stylonectria norvegica]
MDGQGTCPTLPDEGTSDGSTSITRVITRVTEDELRRRQEPIVADDMEDVSLASDDEDDEDDEDMLGDGEDWEMASMPSGSTRAPSPSLSRRQMDDSELDASGFEMMPEEAEPPFDFTIAPFGERVQENYRWEDLHPRRALARAVVENFPGRNQAIQARDALHETFNNVSERVAGAARFGGDVVWVTGHIGGFIAGEALDAGTAVAEDLWERMPGIVGPLRQRFVRRFSGLLREGMNALPPLERQTALGRAGMGRQR